MSRPNVLLLTIDTLRADRLGDHGGSQTVTPNLDRLASSGIRFDQAITGGSWTQAAFPVMLTSTYASMHGGCLGPLSAGRPSPVEALSAHDYATAAFVTSPLLGRAYGYQRGFDHFSELMPEGKDPFLRRIKGGERLLRHTLTHQVAGLIGRSLRPGQLYVEAEQANQDVCNWLESVRQPFFGWVHYMDVHWPYHLESALDSPEGAAQAWQDVAHLYRVNWRGEAISKSQRDRYLDLYDQAIRYVDAQVGELLHCLDQAGLGDNTVIIAVSDHGEEFLERGHWGHVETNLYDEIIRVPLIIHVPGEAGGLTVDRQVRTLDLMPTILELCDCPAPAGMEGVSLTPLWAGSDADYDGSVAISERWRDIGDVSHIVAVRTESFKYIWDAYQPDRSKLYDLNADPAEKINLVPDCPEIVRDLHPQVEALLRKVAATRSEISGIEPELDPATIKRLRDLGYVE
ncbi:MAG: sulfatase [Chloroflexota bacterium]|nr:MAG: sulfatase [Chloroflexota bacterium]